MEIHKGEQQKIGVRFRRGVGPARFLNPPVWTLYNSDDVELLSSPANNEGDRWYASFTVPTRYVVPGGKEELTLQFVGYDATNAEFITDKTLVLVDSAEDFQPNGVVYNLLSQRPLRDTVVLPRDTSAQISVRVVDPTGKTVYEKPAEQYTSANAYSSGNVFEFRLPLTPADVPNKFNDPYQVVYDIESNHASETEIHPLYLLDHRMVSWVNSLVNYLDKARLIEIDPSLQWNQEELIQSVLEGIKVVNSVEPEGTFWTPKDFPPTLERFLFAASAWYALSMRHMAEGLNSFEFQGLNTSLNFNRTEILSAKIDEMNNILERLPPAKRSAISINGKGTPPAGVPDLRKRNLGALRLGVNRLNNRPGWGRNHRFFARL